MRAAQQAHARRAIHLCSSEPRQAMAAQLRRAAPIARRSPEARTCRHVQQFLNLPSAVQAPEVSVYFPPIT